MLCWLMTVNQTPDELQNIYPLTWLKIAMLANKPPIIEWENVIQSKNSSDWLLFVCGSNNAWYKECHVAMTQDAV